MNAAPIVLFVYNRPTHTEKTLSALKKNTLSKYSELFIYSDEAKNDSEKDNVLKVREILSNLTGFKNITITYQNRNKGLSSSIIDGVSSIVNKHGEVIVLEDDIVTSKYFLEYMNEALQRYRLQKDVWHISGWNYPIASDGHRKSAFFWRGMNCWGWATWLDRWQHFEKNPDRLVKQWSKDDISRFNVDGTSDLWSQVLANQSGRLSTWAVFWYATIFENKGLCLNPYQTLVHNIGNDGSGENCIEDDLYKSPMANHPISVFPSTFVESMGAVAKIKSFNRSLTPPYWQRIIRKLKKCF